MNDETALTSDAGDANDLGTSVSVVIATTLVSGCVEKAPEPAPESRYVSSQNGWHGNQTGESGNAEINSVSGDGSQASNSANDSGQLGLESIDNGNVAVQTAPSPRFQSLLPGTDNLISLQASNMMDVIQTMSDGTPLDVWTFYAPGNQNIGFNNDRITPAPTLEVVQNTTVQLRLITTHPHTIHLHGLDVDQANDGVPSTSGYVAGGLMPLPTPPVVGLPRLASPFTYVFTPLHAGTYMYHCHVDTVLHIEKGMSGTIIVRPDNGEANTIWSGGPSFDREYIWHLHTYDSTWHAEAQSGLNTVRYRPDYFLINGKEGLDLLSDPVTTLHAYAGEEILVRAVNIGYLPAEINLGDVTFRVVSSDGRPLAQAIETSQFTIYPGERYDILFNMPTAMNSIATVNYFNIMGTRILGAAQTSITAI